MKSEIGKGIATGLSDDLDARALLAQAEKLLADRALKRSSGMAERLQDAFLSGLVACLTHVMEGFAAGGIFLERQHQPTHGKLRQFVTLCLILPFIGGLKLSVRLLYAVQNVQLRRLKLDELADHLRQHQLQIGIAAGLLRISEQIDGLSDTSLDLLAKADRIADHANRLSNGRNVDPENIHGKSFDGVGEASLAASGSPANPGDRA